MKPRVLSWFITTLCLVLFLLVVFAHADLRRTGMLYYQSFLRGLSADLEVRDDTRIMLDQDSYYWLLYAEAARDQDSLRMPRITHWDNTPEGRDVYWSSPYLWWLQCSHKFSSSIYPAGEVSLVKAAWIANTVLLGAGACLLVVLVGGSGRHIQARLMLAGLIASPQLLWSFFPGRADHHGLIALCAMFFLLALYLGMHSGARKWFLLSALVGALLFWVSAATGVVLLACAVAGLLAGQTLAVFKPLRPGLWIWWGGTGGLLILLFYLIEFYPSWPIRMEVIHPVYALTWIGAGLMLQGVHDYRAGAKPARVLLLIAPLLMCSLPVALMIGVADGSYLLNVTIRRMHRFIDEFRPYLVSVGARPYWTFIQDFGSLLLLPLLLWSERVQSNRRKAWRSDHLAATIVALLLLALTLFQYRWGALFSGALIAALALFPATLPASTPAKAPGFIIRNCFFAALTGLLLYFVAGEYEATRAIAQRKTMPKDLIQQALVRDIARSVRQQHGPGVIRAVGNPPLTPALAYHGGIEGVASLYWENPKGMDTTIAIMLAGTDEQARALMNEHGFNYIIWMTRPAYLAELMVIRDGSHDTERLKKTFGYRMLQGAPELNTWLEPVMYNMPFPEFHGFPGGVRIYRVKIDR
jgi:hypothetical protein